MYLKRLEMNGFKSFLDARIVFQQGITAVVGPNGSGKSNILDAVCGYWESKAQRRCVASEWKTSFSTEQNRESRKGWSKSH